MANRSRKYAGKFPTSSSGDWEAAQHLGAGSPYGEEETAAKAAISCLGDEPVEKWRLKEALVSWEIAQQLRFTTLGYHDPADRSLAATAKTYDMPLVTADQRLLSVPELKVLANI